MATAAARGMHRAPTARVKLHWIIVVGALAGCGTGAGDSTVCQEPPPPCGVDLVTAVDLFSRKGCTGAIESTWCGVNAQALAECLHDAQVCLQVGTTRETVASVLAVSVCAAEFAEWDDCFANGEADSGDDDDWDD